MQEIKIENKAGLQVYINGVPQPENIPKDILDCFINYLTQKLLDRMQK